jgi:transposase InsO family protein
LSELSENRRRGPKVAQRFCNHDEARMALFDFIEGWYNTRRSHSSLDYTSPVRFERQNHRVA